MSAALLAILLLIALSLYQAHKNPDIKLNLLDLFMEGDRLSKVAFVFMISFSFSIWFMIDLALKDKMTEGYFIAFGGLWVSPFVARVLMTKHEPSDKPAPKPKDRQGEP